MKFRERLRQRLDSFQKYRFLARHRLKWKARHKRILKKKMNEVFCISLTSYPARKEFLELSLQSLLLQDYPERVQIVVTLFEKDCEIFQDLVNRYSVYGIEFIATKKDYRSYKKYWPSTIEKYKNCFFVMADDDIAYVGNWLSTLVALHRDFPAFVNGVRGNFIPNEKTSFMSYLNWKKIESEIYGERVFLTTGAGTIFPQNALSDLFLDEDIFLRLAPTADDLYLWNYLVLRGYTFRCKPLPEIVCWPYSQTDGTLWETNSTGNGNNLTIRALVEASPELLNLVKVNP